MADADFRGIVLTRPDPRDWVLGKVLEEWARRAPDRPYLQWEDEPALSFAETNRAVNRLAHGLAAAGVRHGDRVMLLLPNCREYVLTWFALAKLGAVEVPVNSHYRGQFLEHVANNCAARIVVTDGDFLERLAELEPRLTHLERIYVRRPAAEAPHFARLDMRDFGELDSGEEGDPGIKVAHTDIVAILFTSGTTGPSKGVLMPHAQMFFFAEQGASLVRLEADDVYMNAFPLFHGNAQFLTTYPCLIRGARAVLYERFSAGEWIDRIRRNGVTVTNLLGVTMDFVFKQPARPDDADNRLRLVYAVPTAHAILDGFKRRFDVHVFVDAFGQTETCWPLMTPFDEPRPPGAVGKVVADWYEVRLVDPETDEDVSEGELGELVVRHRMPWTLCAGYNANPDATLRAMRNLWWHTGDGMRRDAQGWYYFVDRVNDALRVKGENVSSYEVEQVVLGHPDVLECAAVGLRTEAAGGEHDIKVDVVLRPGVAPDPVALIRHCEAHAPHFAVPRFVEFVATLPRTPSEKIQKHIIRRAGITPATWDRVAAGVLLAHELKRHRR
jgi:crotonobetaine/carnitine-CoA ligase